MKELTTGLSYLGANVDNIFVQCFIVFMMINLFRRLLLLDIKFPDRNILITVVSSFILSISLIAVRSYLGESGFDKLIFFDRAGLLFLCTSFGYEIIRVVYVRSLEKYLKIKVDSEDIMDVEEEA